MVGAINQIRSGFARQYLLGRGLPSLTMALVVATVALGESLLRPKSSF